MVNPYHTTGTDAENTLGFYTVGESNAQRKIRTVDGQTEVKLSDFKQICQKNGGTVTFPKLEQAIISGQLSGSRYYEVDGFVARVKNEAGGYDYYELSGWKKDGTGDAIGVYDVYTPTGDDTLKAQWNKIDLPTAADENAPLVPLLKTWDVSNQTYYAELQQQVTGGDMSTLPAETASDGKITYQVQLNFSEIFKHQTMPWYYGNNYFKNIDNEKFADFDVVVKLNDNLEFDAGKDGKTTITVKNAHLKLTGVEYGDASKETVVDSTSAQNTQTIQVAFGDKVNEFTIDFDWDMSSTATSDMQIIIPLKVKEGVSGEVSAPEVTISGGFDFNNAHNAPASGDNATVTADEMARLLLTMNKEWNQYFYKGGEQTLTQLLTAAKQIELKLKHFEFKTNPLTATASVDIDSMTVEHETVELTVGETATPTVTITPDGANKNVTWNVTEGTGVVTVDATTGKITAVKPGTAKVTGTSVYDSNKTVVVNVTVKGVVYVEPTTGGTVTIKEDENVTKLLDNVYSVKQGATVTVTVTPDGSNVMAGENPFVYYGTNTEVEDVNGSGPVFTFTMPAESPVYVSAAFVIKNDSGNTVIDAPKTVTEGNNHGYNDVGEVNVTMSDDAVSEMLRHVTEHGTGKYSVDQLKEALTTAGVTEQTDVYRHIQTQTKISVDGDPDKTNLTAALGARKFTLNIDFQYRVVASNQADPDEIDLNSGSKNAAIMEPGSTEGWGNYESTEDTYIIVPIPTQMGSAGDWIKATHTHEEQELPSQYLQIQSDGTVTYINTHEGGFSPFTFEQMIDVKDILIDNSVENIDIDFAPNKAAYTAQVGSNVETLKITPQFMSFMTGAGGMTTNVTQTLTVNGQDITGAEAGGSTVYEVPLVNNSVNRIVFEFKYNDITQTYTINITRGTLPVPPSPSTYTVKTETVENATVVTSASSARAGETVTVTVTPAESYHVSGVTVTAANGAAVEVKENEDGTYTFTMPASNVTVTATVYKCPSLAYTDLDVTQWYHPYVDYAITHDLMEGVGDGVFAPEKTVTRAQMAGILWNLEGQPVVNYLMTFTDVPDGKWYTEAIRWAASEGIISGFGDGTFRPEDTITREQMAAMLYFYEQKLGSGGFTGDWEFNLTFDDAADISPWAREAVAWCTMKGVITGSDNKFNPSGSSKRAHLATILALYDQLENN